MPIKGLIETTRFYRSFLYALPIIFFVDIWYALALPLFLLFSFAFNDYIDAEKDKLGHPERPIPSGRLSKNFVGNTSVIIVLAAVIITASLVPSYLGVFLVALLLSALYSSLIKPTYPALATIFWSLAVALATISGFNLGLISVIGFTLIVYAYEISLDVRDKDTDKLYYKRRTIAELLNDYTLPTSAGLLVLGLIMLIYAL